ncbi:hypothetical protein AB0C52_06200 [Streptomyces sp. NPDC048717]|uniref:hypothetical protein n=1 Tax=Streptomyces sp. NPDC048717 TaxID=3154928 RepID=UPI0034274181
MTLRRIIRPLGSVLASLLLTLTAAGAASAEGDRHDARAPRAVPDITVSIDSPTAHRVTMEPIPLATGDIGIGLSTPGADNIQPGWRDSWTGVVVNHTNRPMEVFFEGLWLEGTIAPFIELGFEGWHDVTLQPGESSAQFTIDAAMPPWVGNIAMGTSGTIHAAWEVVPVGPPVPPEPPCEPGYGTGHGAGYDHCVETPVRARS